MKQALEGVVVVPWALMLDKWRSGVFNGEIKEEELNSSWWKLRKQYEECYQYMGIKKLDDMNAQYMETKTGLWQWVRVRHGKMLLKILLDQDNLSGNSIINYYAPLKDWLMKKIKIELVDGIKYENTTNILISVLSFVINYGIAHLTGMN